jgi:hypothetical protein
LQIEKRDEIKISFKSSFYNLHSSFSWFSPLSHPIFIHGLFSAGTRCRIDAIMYADACKGLDEALEWCYNGTSRPAFRSAGVRLLFINKRDF